MREPPKQAKIKKWVEFDPGCYPMPTPDGGLVAPRVPRFPMVMLYIGRTQPIPVVMN